MKKIKLIISLWIEGVFTNIIKFFDNLEDAIIESKMWDGIVKIYDHIGLLLHCGSKYEETYA